MMIVIDIETSGVDAYANSILSIGAIDFEEPNRRFYKECRLREGAGYSGESLAVNGFNVEDIKSKTKPHIKDVLTEFASWAIKSRDYTPAGHNVMFDISFIESDLKRYNIGFSLGHRSVDMHAIAYAHMLSRGITPPAKRNRTDLNSDMIFEYSGINKEPRPHNALIGAKMEAESLCRIIYGRWLLEEYKAYTVPNYFIKHE